MKLGINFVAQAFQSRMRDSRDFLVASSSQHGTGKSREPADKNVCVTTATEAHHEN